MRSTQILHVPYHTAILDHKPKFKKLGLDFFADYFFKKGFQTRKVSKGEFLPNANQREAKVRNQPSQAVAFVTFSKYANHSSIILSKRKLSKVCDRFEISTGSR